jgi:hypothetical protein
MVLSAALFSWRGKEGVAFESDLPEHYAGRLYDDAADWGFLCRSTKTGKILAFSRSSEITSPDAEHVGWAYETSDGLKITIFNT